MTRSTLTYEQYSANKHRAEMLSEGYVEYASVEIKHFHRHCNCGGDNPQCRQVTHREWRKPPSPEATMEKNNE